LFLESATLNNPQLMPHPCHSTRSAPQTKEPLLVVLKWDGMERRGVPQKTARTVSGHKTDAVFSRYNMVSDADIAGAAKKIQAGAKAAVSGSIHNCS
jgi:hypothetical protein